ncbi:MAG: thioredoxin family protein [Thermoproteota archaeon]|nr:thioredoxin family protein [Thermoproteota archaeon]
MEHLEPTQFDKLFAVGGKVLVMFYADWCPFCQRFKPLFESVAAKSSSNATNYKMYGAKVNADDNPLWDRFSINAVPTIIAFDKGNIISRRDAKMSAGLNESDLDSILKEIGIYPL